MKLAGTALCLARAFNCKVRPVFPYPKSFFRRRLVGCGLPGILSAFRFGTRPNAGVLGVGHGQHQRLFVDHDGGGRVAWPEQQVAALVNIVAALQAAADAADEDVVAQQHGQGRVAAEFVA